MRLLEQFYGVIAPSLCLRCGQEGSLLCAWCSEDALPEQIERCYRCNKLSNDSRTCTACRRHTAIGHLWVRSEYSDTARLLVHAMKFKYSGEAADRIAKELAHTIPALPPHTLVVPIPTVTSHVRQRGFDHSSRIAKCLARPAGLRCLPALMRFGQKRQVGSSRRDRLEQVTDAFAVRSSVGVNGERILLVDDVLTTGATLESAARALKEAGAKHVDAVIFAKAK